MSIRTANSETMFGEEYSGEDPDEICDEYVGTEKVRRKKKRGASRAASRRKGGK